ncbi:Recombination inhibitory protein MutS2 [Desulfurella amilsii]|uniref:Recombination inhibitory protein MutS2 n=1 Tax=Desulfurella amilsii TaxID=1562698 RepID=A0A1X4Y040_9BACT|nr:Smr/MutS family protein [Desulfurella amilsii]OSS43161.1 Recombination inhibitory protein MutS2 [Desulfurella amilsii]
MKSCVEILEFDKLKNILNEFAQTTYGKEYTAQIEPIFDFETVQQSTKFLEIFFEVLGKSIPTLDDIYIDTYLNQASYSILSAKEIYYVYTFIDFISNLNKNLEDKLKNYITFANLDKLKILIAQTIDETGYVKDASTKKLSFLRSKIKSTKDEIATFLHFFVRKKGLQNILLDTNVFLKNSRFTILVKPNYKEYIKARKVDISKAGFFVEPYEVFEKNNYLEDLILEETKETQKILTAFTNLIRKYTKELIHNTKELAKLDSFCAKILFANKFDAHLTHFDETKRLIAQDLKHPLLLKTQQNVVGNSLELNGSLIITGPNTGGKTVFIKQVGLAVLCAFATIPVCAQYFCVGKVSNVFAVIGDEQQTESLSTFSSNMVRIKEIIEKFDENSLILLDEPGSGTSPEEAYAIVYAIFSYLNKKNPMLIMSTHYRNLVYKLKEIDNVRLAAFEFNEEKLQPTYKLVFGKIGKSYGIEIMQKYLNNEIFEISKKVFESKESQIFDKYEKELNDMINKKALYTNLIKRYKMLFNKLNLEIAQLKQNLLSEHNETVNQYNHLFDSLKKEISRVIKTKEIKDAQRLVNTLETANIHPKIQNLNNPQTFEKGDTVQLGKSIGTIIGIKGEYVQVNIDGKIVSAKTSLLEKKQPKIKQSSLNVIHSPKETKELNIIGMHAFEAELEVLQFLEYAALNNIKEVRIIHGKGSGVLKEMVRNLLKEHKSVESFSMAPPNLGGDGATIVILK